MWIKLNYGDMYIKVQMVAKNEKRKKQQQHYGITAQRFKYDGWLFGVTISGREEKTARNVNPIHSIYALYLRRA